MDSDSNMDVGRRAAPRVRGEAADLRGGSAQAGARRALLLQENMEDTRQWHVTAALGTQTSCFHHHHFQPNTVDLREARIYINSNETNTDECLL